MTFILRNRFLAFRLACLGLVTLAAGQQMTVDLQTGHVTSSSGAADDGFEFLDRPTSSDCSGRCDLKGLVRLSFDNVTRGYAHIDMRFSDATFGHFFHVRDKKVSGDDDLASQSEIIFINESIIVYNSDEDKPRRPLHAADNMIHYQVVLDIADGNVLVSSGERALSLKSHKLFRMDVTSGLHTSPKHDVYLGFNRAVDNRDRLEGQGLCSVSITWEACP